MQDHLVCNVRYGAQQLHRRVCAGSERDIWEACLNWPLGILTRSQRRIETLNFRGTFAFFASPWNMTVQYARQIFMYSWDCAWRRDSKEIGTGSETVESVPFIFSLRFSTIFVRGFQRMSHCLFVCSCLQQNCRSTTLFRPRKSMVNYSICKNCQDVSCYIWPAAYLWIVILINSVNWKAERNDHNKHCFLFNFSKNFKATRYYEITDIPIVNFKQTSRMDRMLKYERKKISNIIAICIL